MVTVPHLVTAIGNQQGIEGSQWCAVAIQIYSKL